MGHLKIKSFINNENQIIFKLFSNSKFGKIMVLNKLNSKIFFNKRYKVSLVQLFEVRFFEKVEFSKSA